MSNVIKTKKLIKQQINLGVLSSHINKSIKKNVSINDNQSQISNTINDFIINSNTSSTSISTGSLVVCGGTGIAENLFVGGKLDIASDFLSNGNNYINGLVNISGLTTTKGGILVPTGKSIDIRGDSKLLVENGKTILGGELNVTGLATMKGGILVPPSKSINVCGDSTLTVENGKTILGGELKVKGLITTGGGIKVPSGQSVILKGTSTLTVDGITTFNGPTVLTNSLITTEDKVIISKDTNLSATLNVSGEIYANGGINIQKNTKDKSTLTVEGTSIFNGITKINNSLIEGYQNISGTGLLGEIDLKNPISIISLSDTELTSINLLEGIDGQIKTIIRNDNIDNSLKIIASSTSFNIGGLQKTEIIFGPETSGYVKLIYVSSSWIVISFSGCSFL